MDSCVTAKTNRRVQCKTLSCSAIVSNYKIGDVEYYYAKRGCTADPEASHIEGEQYPADKETVPKGWTGIKQYNQRTSIKNGNTLRKGFRIFCMIFCYFVNFVNFRNPIRATKFSIAQEFQCYSCESNFSSKSTSWAEPTYDSIRSKDSSFCWEIVSSSASVVGTGTTGQCFNECFTQAYKYSLRTDSGREFYWNIKRGCRDDVAKPSSLYGVQASTKCSVKFIL